MMPLSAASISNIPAFRRLSNLAPLDREEIEVLKTAANYTRSVAARRGMTAAFGNGSKPLLILDGWGHRSYLLSDGRRQITEFFLPGDLVLSDWSECSNGSATAITNLTYCQLPADRVALLPGLTAALHASHSIDERLLRRQIVRLGRLDALERVTDWMLEMYERLSLSGMCSGNTMPMPATQEIIGDALGLTSVHVNRTLGILRRENLLNVQSGRATFLDLDSCRSIVR